MGRWFRPVEESTIRKTPWHRPDDDVHHDSTKCPAGAKVLRGEFKPGTGGKPACPECDRAERNGPERPGTESP